MRLAALLVLTATAACEAGRPDSNETTVAAPAPAAPAPTTAEDGEEGESAAAGAAAGDEPAPDDRFISCPGHPRCPKGQEQEY